MSRTNNNRQLLFQYELHTGYHFGETYRLDEERVELLPTLYLL